MPEPILCKICDKRRARRNPDPYEGLADDELAPIDDRESVVADSH